MTAPLPGALALGQWLSQALNGLADRVKPRLAEEVTAHYLDAHEEALGRGLPDSEAQARALLSLGSPRDAQRAFRRVYLTSQEETFCRECMTDLRCEQNLWRRNEVVPFGDILLFGLFIPFMFMYGLIEGLWATTFTALLCWLVVILYRLPSVQRCLGALPERWAVPCQSGYACCTLAVLFLPAFNSGRIWLRILAVMFLVLWTFASIRSDVRLIRKLKHPYNQQDNDWLADEG